MQTDSPALPPVTDWQARQLQFTVFPTSPQFSEAMDLSEAQKHWVSGAQAKLPFAARGDPPVFEVAGGDTERRIISLIIDRLLFMWTVSQDGGPETASLGPFPTVREWFAEGMTRWLSDHCPPIKRLVFACWLLQPMTEREAASRRVGDYLHWVLKVPVDSDDFLFQINRKRRLAVGPSEVEVNRLAAWASVSLASGAGCQLKLDINTDPNRTEELEKTALTATLRSFLTYATEIAAAGNIVDTP